MALQVRRNNWKYQSGLLPKSQAAGALQAGSALRMLSYGSACAQARGSTLQACRCVQEEYSGDEQSDHFLLENDVLQWKMAQSGASGGAAPGRGA